MEQKLVSDKISVTRYKIIFKSQAPIFQTFTSKLNPLWQRGKAELKWLCNSINQISFLFIKAAERRNISNFYKRIIYTKLQRSDTIGLKGLDISVSLLRSSIVLRKDSFTELPLLCS
ncbi:MAG: hypothetical protein DRQ01_04665 [Ignavibacteriae bacterium]|nr:MAG: hypothetical protein DRQ01_04665 [Ignavibacteriota bacterium]